MITRLSPRRWGDRPGGAGGRGSAPDRRVGASRGARSMDGLQSEDTSSFEVAGLTGVVAACERFETRWRDGGDPPIDEFLEAVAPPLRERLLRELLAIEIELRTARGESPTARRLPPAPARLGRRDRRRLLAGDLRVAPTERTPAAPDRVPGRRPGRPGRQRDGRHPRASPGRPAGDLGGRAVPRAIRPIRRPVAARPRRVRPRLPRARRGARPAGRDQGPPPGRAPRPGAGRVVPGRGPTRRRAGPPGDRPGLRRRPVRRGRGLRRLRVRRGPRPVPGARGRAAGRPRPSRR